MTASPRTPGEWITASQVADYAYCAESWRLAHGLGRESRHEPLMQQGIAAHDAWQGTERASARVTRLGLALMLIALAGLLLRWLGG
jgi:hypothetical protein